MSIANLLSELGSQMGLSDLRPNEHGVCRLVFDQKLNVDIEPSQNGKSLLIYTPVGKVPEEAGAAFYRMLLDASLFARGTGGSSTLALDSDEGEVFLQSILPLDKLDAITLTSTLEDFLNTAETWTKSFSANEFPQLQDESGGYGGATQGEVTEGDLTVDRAPAHFIRA